MCSSLGKGIAAASIGAIMKASGFSVSIRKLDPYLNVDPGTMSPFQHGEVFVTDDGAETDLDLGHYERFIDENLTHASTVTTGRIYSQVLEKERKGKYLGRTIQIVPHITNAIKENIQMDAEKYDILVIEIGGTVGDIEGEPFLEAMRQMRSELGHHNVLSVHLTLLPFLQASGELKTKPTQLSVRELKRVGMTPDIIIARSDVPVSEKILKKISRFCDVAYRAVFPAETVPSIYQVPLKLQSRKIAEVIAEKLSLGDIKPKLREWKKLNKNIEVSTEEICIGLAGKYNGLDDAYLSVFEAIKSAGYFFQKKIRIVWIDMEDIEKGLPEEIEKMKKCKGIVVPGGFGIRGTEGKIFVAKYCRETKTPYLGLCLGSQILAIEFARHVGGITDATSEEFDSKAKNPIVHFLPGQSEDKAKGGTLRLGSYPCVIRKGTTAAKAYKSKEVSERHRHRYEFNNAYRKQLEDAGLVFSGVSPDDSLVEIVEVPNHPFMVGTQFHPEFKSRPNKPHPLFRDFMQAVIG